MCGKNGSKMKILYHYKRHVGCGCAMKKIGAWSSLVWKVSYGGFEGCLMSVSRVSVGCPINPANPIYPFNPANNLPILLIHSILQIIPIQANPPISPNPCQFCPSCSVPILPILLIPAIPPILKILTAPAV